MKYQAAPGAPFGDQTAQHIGEMLEPLGRFTPAQVVDMGRDEHSVLYPYFEWNDRVAAEGYRLYQARQIVNHIQVVIETGGRSLPTKAFHHVSILRADGNPEGTDTYVTVHVARQNDELKNQIIQKALSELKSWQRRYAEYSQIFGELFDEIDKAAVQIESRIEPVATR